MSVVVQSGLGVIKSSSTLTTGIIASGGDTDGLAISAQTSDSGLINTNDLSVIGRFWPNRYEQISAGIAQQFQEYKVVKCGISFRMLQGPNPASGSWNTGSETSADRYPSVGAELYVRTFDVSNEVPNSEGVDPVSVAWMRDRRVAPMTFNKGTTKSFSWIPHVFVAETPLGAGGAQGGYRKMRAGWYATGAGGINNPFYGKAFVFANLPCPGGTVVDSMATHIEVRTWAKIKLRKLVTPTSA